MHTLSSTFRLRRLKSFLISDGIAARNIYEK